MIYKEVLNQGNGKWKKKEGGDQGVQKARTLKVHTRKERKQLPGEENKQRGEEIQKAKIGKGNSFPRVPRYIGKEGNLSDTKSKIEIEKKLRTRWFGEPREKARFVWGRGGLAVPWGKVNIQRKPKKKK